MDFEKFLSHNQAQKQIDKLAQKYKNKKIVIYGAAEYFDIITQNYDLSKLNIVGISDIKFQTDKTTNQTSYLALTPEELRTYDFDILIIALKDNYKIMTYLDKNIFQNSKNKNIKIIPIVYPTLKYLWNLYFTKSR